ncbi:MAG: DUF1573 domain-containing protein [Flavobacteriales bacterium]
MKTFFISVLVAVSSSFAFAQELSFENTVHNYGSIDYSADGTCEFTFTNTGDKPLIISRAKGSCGCTVPTYSREPIMPGKSGEIKVKYDTKRPGNFTKSVTVYSNSTKGASVSNDTTGQTTVRLTIKGKVGPKPTKAEQNISKDTQSPMVPTAG